MGKWCRGRHRIGANKWLKTYVFLNAVLKVAPKVAPKLKSGPNILIFRARDLRSFEHPFNLYKDRSEIPGMSS